MSAITECCQEIDCSGCGSFLGDFRNPLASVTSSLFFFTGWWIIIDSAVRCNIAENPSLMMYDYYHVCGVVGTLAFFLINAVSNSLVRGEGDYDGVRKFVQQHII